MRATIVIRMSAAAGIRRKDRWGARAKPGGGDEGQDDEEFGGGGEAVDGGIESAVRIKRMGLHGAARDRWGQGGWGWGLRNAD